jgi:predicted nuclease of predicted toxin-antitoxin system
MSLRLLVDESAGKEVAAYLRRHGYDVVSVTEVFPQADDSWILQYAVSDRRIVITNDKDFGDMVFRDQGEHCGIILLRLSNTSATVKKQVALHVIQRYGEELVGAFCVASEKRSRLR